MQSFTPAASRHSKPTLLIYNATVEICTKYWWRIIKIGISLSVLWTERKKWGWKQVVAGFFEFEIVGWKLCLGKNLKFSQWSTIKKSDELEILQVIFNQVFGNNVTNKQTNKQLWRKIDIHLSKQTDKNLILIDFKRNK